MSIFLNRMRKLSQTARAAECGHVELSLFAFEALIEMSQERDRYAARIKKLEAERDEMRRILK